MISNWVEHGKAPDQIIASRLAAQNKVDKMLLVCPYPQVAKYKGPGSADDPQNFACSER